MRIMNAPEEARAARRDEQKTNLIKPNLVCRSMMQKKIYSFIEDVWVSARFGESGLAVFVWPDNGRELKVRGEKLLAMVYEILIE